MLLADLTLQNKHGRGSDFWSRIFKMQSENLTNCLWVDCNFHLLNVLKAWAFIFGKNGIQLRNQCFPQLTIWKILPTGWAWLLGLAGSFCIEMLLYAHCHGHSCECFPSSVDAHWNCLCLLLSPFYRWEKQGTQGSHLDWYSEERIEEVTIAEGFGEQGPPSERDWWGLRKGLGSHPRAKTPGRAAFPEGMTTG